MPNEFRQIRLSLGLSQSEVGKELGLSQSAISRIEAAEKPNKRDLLAIKALARSKRSRKTGEAA
jgi:transcriptional regulator with XRE-family HTH domain